MGAVLDINYIKLPYEKGLAYCAGVILVWANVIGSRLFNRPAVFDLELEWTVGEGGGERARRHLPEEDVEKQNTPWVVARHCIPEISRQPIKMI